MATASILLLYYHLIREGGIAHNQTVYIDPALFDPFKFVDLIVDGQGLEIDQEFIREGATIHLLRDLSDAVSDCESEYMIQPFVRRVISILEKSDTQMNGVTELISIIKKTDGNDFRLSAVSESPQSSISRLRCGKVRKSCRCVRHIIINATGRGRSIVMRLTSSTAANLGRFIANQSKVLINT